MVHQGVLGRYQCVSLARQELGVTVPVVQSLLFACRLLRRHCRYAQRRTRTTVYHFLAIYMVNI